MSWWSHHIHYKSKGSDRSLPTDDVPSTAAALPLCTAAAIRQKGLMIHLCTRACTFLRVVLATINFCIPLALQVFACSFHLVFWFLWAFLLLLTWSNHLLSMELGFRWDWGMDVHVCVRVHACVHACLRACMRACVHACVRACMHTCMCMCVYLCD